MSRNTNVPFCHICFWGLYLCFNLRNGFRFHFFFLIFETGSPYVDQGDLKSHRDLPASDSLVLEFKVCAYLAEYFLKSCCLATYREQAEL